VTKQVRVRLVAFAILSVLAVAHAAVRYVGVDDAVLQRTIRVSVDLPESGGLYAGSEVTLRGQGVGKVTDVVLSSTGVKAIVALDADADVPSDVQAAVHNRSAVGEQYLDLVPAPSKGVARTSVLKDGGRIARAATSVPIAEEELIGNLDAFVASVPREDLRTVVNELGRGFVGTGDDLGRLIDGSSKLLDRATTSLPASLQLTTDALKVLQTQADGAEEIKQSASGYRQVFGTVRQRDAELRRILADAGPLATELSRLVSALGPRFPQFLSQLSALSTQTGRHLDGLEQALVAIPFSVASTANGVLNGRQQFILAATPEPAVCRNGYLPAEQWRSPYDTTRRPIVFGLGCRDAEKVPRGAANAPR